MDKKKVVSIRKERNSDLLRRMNNGESLTSYDSSSSWFPPRPNIEKDPKAMSRLYDKKIKAEEKKAEETKEEKKDSNLVVLPMAQ